jgi:hypothetical protein
MAFSQPLKITVGHADGVVVTAAAGVLDSTTYLKLRNAVIEAALDEPRAVVVDVTELSVPVPSAWVVFTSAHWHVNRWRDVPMALVGVRPWELDAIRREGLTRHLPVYSTAQHAAASIRRKQSSRRWRAHADLASPESVRQAQHLVRTWLTSWSQTDIIPRVSAVATVFVENVVCHTAGEATLYLESDGKIVTVAVKDTSSAPAQLRESDTATRRASGLAVVEALCRQWGNSPTGISGKTVWAVIDDGRPGPPK